MSIRENLPPARICLLVAPCWFLASCFVTVAPEVQERSGQADGEMADEEVAGMAGAQVASDEVPKTRESGSGGTSDEMAARSPLVPLAECSLEAVDLIAQVNLYRSQNGKPRIQESQHLCTVSQLHVDDLIAHAVHEKRSECAPQSWSGAGPESSCCYRPSGENAECSWEKPSELTGYPTEGYEIVAIFVDGWREALDAWTSQPSHRDLLLNQGQFQGTSWKAMGADMRFGHAVLWLGASVDPVLD